MATSSGRSTKRKPSSITTYEDALAWLDQRVDLEKLPHNRAVADSMKLERMHKLMAVLGDPHKQLKLVHVAGTKGKGSTCEMVASCLESCGYAVGLYTSPHLVDVRERVRVNRVQIEQDDFKRVLRVVAEAEATLHAADAAIGDATFFEVLTAMAFVHFAEQAVDVGVIEVGLGGRLDSTNVIVPEVSAVSSISLDHMQILGDTVEKIAREKAGIFKPGIPAVVVNHKPSVMEVFKDVAQNANAPLSVVGVDIDFSQRFDAKAIGGPRTFVTVSTKRNTFEHMAVPLMGEHQAQNCGLALAILDKLSERGFKVPVAQVTKGLATVKHPGRMELIKGTPRVLLDGAHNAESMQVLMKAISSFLSYDALVVIFGCAADKDIDGMLRELASGADKVIFTKSISSRAADPRELARRFTDLGKMCQSAPDLEHALVLAKRAAQRDDLVCITGSLYLVGDAKRMVASHKKETRGT